MDKVGKQTLEIMKSAPLYNRWLLSLLKKHLSGNILEIGAGIGNFTLYLQKYGTVTALDIDKYYISKLKKIVTKPDLAGYGDIEKAEYYFANKKFDCIVCLNVLEHIKNDQIALKNMYSLIKKGGKLLLLVPAHQFAYTPMDKALGHFRRYTKKSLSKMAIEVGFEVNNIRYYNLPGIIGWFVNGKLLRKKLIPKSQLGMFDKVSVPWLTLEKKLPVPFGLSVMLIATKK